MLRLVLAEGAEASNQAAIELQVSYAPVRRVRCAEYVAAGAPISQMGPIQSVRTDELIDSALVAIYINRVRFGTLQAMGIYSV